MVIISYYLKSVCLRDSLSLVRPDTGLAAGPAYSLASCYCFCRSLSMNSPFRLRPGSRPGFRLAPATRPPGRSGLHPPLFRSGVQKYTFFPNRQTFREKFFEKFFSPRGSRPLSPCPAPAGQDRKSTAFSRSAKLFPKNFS